MKDIAIAMLTAAGLVSSLILVAWLAKYISKVDWGDVDNGKCQLYAQTTNSTHWVVDGNKCYYTKDGKIISVELSK